MNTRLFLNQFFRCLLTIGVVTTLLSTTNALATNGALDSTFGVGGIVSTQFNALPSSAHDLALQADGKIVVLGNVSLGDGQSSKIITRYNNNGTMDSSFGANGITPIQVPSFLGSKIAIQPDGKLIVGGSSEGKLAVICYDSNGTQDVSFGTNGIGVVQFGSESHQSPADMAIQPDGKIVMGGDHTLGQSNYTDFFIARFNANGTPDETFVGNGFNVIDRYSFPNNRYNYGEALGIQPDGKIVLSGNMMDNDGKNQISLARINPNGSLDTSNFGTNGKGTVTTAMSDFQNSRSALAFQSDGKFVVAGTIFKHSDSPTNNLALIRYTSNGLLDTSFGGTGIVITDFGDDEQLDDLIIQADGKIIAEGKTSNLDSSSLLLVRYNSDGSLDTSFGANGKVVTDFGSSAETATGILQQPDGKVIISGVSGNNAILARYETGTPAATSSFTFKSVGAHDGWILESGENSNKGGSLDKISNVMFVGDAARDRQYRSFLSFDTNSIPDNAIITSAEVRVKRQGVIGTDPFKTHGDLLLEIRNGTFSNETTLDLEDFAAIANVGSTRDKFSGAVSNWHTATLSNINLGLVNKHGLTQFRLLFSLDDNDDMNADYIKLFSGNSTADQPQLLVTYSTSSIPNRPPVIHGGAAISINIPENTTTVTTVGAADPDGQPIAYSISGSDAGRFSINTDNGQLTFLTTPDFESIPLGTVYRLTVQVTDGSLTAAQDISVSVTPVNEFAPAVTSSANISLPENTIDVTTITATDADLPSPTIEYVIAGGADWQLFNLDPSSGKLSFVTAPSYNAPNDSGLDHVYNVKVEVQDEEYATPLELVISIIDPNVPTGEMLDSSFGVNGIVTMKFDNQPSSVRGIGLQSDGKIVMLGGYWVQDDNNDSTYRKFLIRYNSNGSLDTSFGTNGIAPIEIEYFNASTIELQADGKIIVASGGGWISVARFNNNGSLDTSFGINGVNRLEVFEHQGGFMMPQSNPTAKLC
jgi:uncharacterized delta-60 repeat protein